MGRIAGIDYGTVRIGIAISDQSGIIATSHAVLSAHKKQEATAIALLEALSPFKLDAIVIGMPYKLSGKASFMGDEVLHFVEILKAKTPIPILLWDERLTSLQAERSLKEAGLNRKKRSKIVDAISAVIMLQSYLDSLQWKRHDNLSQ